MNHNTLSLEKRFHDTIAKDFLLQRQYDFLWEIPEKLFLFKKKFLQNKSIIEMGCGPALVISKVVRNQKIILTKYTGVDISKNMISLAKKNFPQGKFYIGDMTRSYRKLNQADTIISLGALHHADDKHLTLKKWIKLLKPQGYLLLREPLIEALKKGTGYTPNEEGIEINKLISYLKKSDMKVIKDIYFSSQFFHIINHFFKAILGNFWVKHDLLWYPVIFFDLLISNTIGKRSSKLKGEACILIAQKV